MNNNNALAHFQHKHDFSNTNNDGERNTRYVLYLTLITMVAEITAGTVYGSMALLADGWHMGTHAAAFMITLFAYHYARKHANNPEFSFGTGKVSVLGGFTSAIALGLVALMMLVESGMRLFNPHQIQFNEAILVAFIGLTVNVISVFLLKDHHSHSHGHSHGHSHNHSHGHSHSDNHQDGHAHQQAHADSAHSHDSSHEAGNEIDTANRAKGHDHNLRAAYFHVLADALTSILAIGALLLGKLYGLNWLDPVMGIVGSIIISRWAWQLLKQTSPILLDASIEREYREKVMASIESEEGVLITDLHIWRVSADHYSLAISIVASEPKEAEYYRNKLKEFSVLSHLTIEVNCHDQAKYTPAI